MDRGWYARFFVVIAALVLGVGFLWPSLDAWVSAPAWLKNIVDGRISPGLDIRGGLRLQYEVLVDEAIEHRRDRNAEELFRRIGRELDAFEDEDAPNNEEIDELRERVRVEAVGDQGIRVTFQQENDRRVLSHQLIEESFPGIRLTSDTEGTVGLTLRDDAVENLREEAVEQTKEVIIDRIDNLGVREAAVYSRDRDIIVEVPGATEEQFDYIRSLINRTARLEFKIVDDQGSAEFIAGLSDLPEGIEREREGAGMYLVAREEVCETDEAGERVCTQPRQLLQNYINGLEFPEGRHLVIGELEGGAEGQPPEGWRTWYLRRTAGVTGDDVEDALVVTDPNTGRWVVSLQFNAEGAEDFGTLTTQNVRERMAIVLDHRVESAPVINEPITGGRAQITLGFGDARQLLAEAEALVIVLKAGALPAPIRPANEQLIGPTLGTDSVQQGAMGALIGIGLVLLFMLLYYQVAGLVADLMVILNVLLLLAMQAALDATLTLPGIAAIALTVGMAVDANVLITERIREELRLGKTPRSAVEHGFKRAFWSIWDAQITTFIAGVVLLQYGTGPIKGFAVTLMIGIVSSIFTGVFCSRVVFDWIARGLKVQRLRVG